MIYSITPGEPVEMTVYLYYNVKYNWVTVTSINHWEKGNQLSGDGEYYLIDKKSITFNAGNFDLNDIKINGLEAQLQRDIADSFVRQQKMRDKIQELRCIGHDGDVVG